MHSFVHPHIVQLTDVQRSQGAVLTVTAISSSKVLCNNVYTLDLTFTAEEGDRQVTVSLLLSVLDGL